MTRWGMVIDLKKCESCYACEVACKQEHFLPPNIFWNRLLVVEREEQSVPKKLVYPILCNHCKEAPCIKACPTGASKRREDGIVVVESDKCIGCQYCVVVCPYQQRSYHADNKKEYFPGQGLTELEVIGQKIYPHRPGTTIKCNFCVERIDKGIQQGLKPGIDRQATPACVITCPAKARYFGDLDDPLDNVSVLIKNRNGYQLRPEFGTDPSVYYIE